MGRALLLVASMLGMATCLDGPEPGPRTVREDTEWLDVWLPDSNRGDRPRALLVGDSIARGYGPGVARRLEGRAYVGRLATSKSLGDPALLAEVALVLGQARFDVVHFNNGLHGFGYTEDEYRAALPGLIAAIRKGAPGARLIWAATTPIRDRDRPAAFDPRTARVRARNAVAAEVIRAEGIPVDDLFALVAGHPEYHALDGIHFGEKGTEAQAEQVARSILAALPPRR